VQQIAGRKATSFASAQRSRNTKDANLVMYMNKRINKRKQTKSERT